MQHHSVESMLSRLDEDLSKHKAQGAYAVFDFDNTCICNDVCEALLAYVCKHSLMRNLRLLPKPLEIFSYVEYSKAIFLHYYDLLDRGAKEEAYLFAAKVFAGFSVAEIQKMLMEMLAYEGTALGKRELFGRSIANGLCVREQVAALLNELQKRNIALWIISASPEVLVKELMQKWFSNIAATVIGIRASIDHDGIITDVLVPPFPTFHGKVDCIKQFIDPHEKPILAVGDSNNDRAMLDYAHLKVVVDTGGDFANMARVSGPDWYVI